MLDVAHTGSRGGGTVEDAERIRIAASGRNAALNHQGKHGGQPGRAREVEGCLRIVKRSLPVAELQLELRPRAEHGEEEAFKVVLLGELQRPIHQWVSRGVRRKLVGHDRGEADQGPSGSVGPALGECSAVHLVQARPGLQIPGGEPGGRR